MEFRMALMCLGSIAISAGVSFAIATNVAPPAYSDAAIKARLAEVESKERIDATAISKTLDLGAAMAKGMGQQVPVDNWWCDSLGCWRDHRCSGTDCARRRLAYCTTSKKERLCISSLQLCQALADPNEPCLGVE